MAEAREVQLRVIVDNEETKEANSGQNPNITNQSIVSQGMKYKWWLRIVVYVILLLAGQTVAILLGRLYYLEGGKSRCMATLMQFAGFPILFLYYCILSSPSKNKPPSDVRITELRSPWIVASVYVSLGLINAANGFLLAIGMQYLPVSTVTLISATTLTFNAFFSFLLNSQKFTPLIINSLVLLTISSTLLVFQNDSANLTGVSKVKHAVGFICTVVGSAGTGLLLALTQLAFRKVLKRGTLKENMDLILFQSIVSTSATLVALFASGEWKGLTKEMEEYELGKISYILTIACAAIWWQLFSIGGVGLIFEVSSLFCNAISVLGFPLVSVLAVIFFHDKMDGVKVISMVLAIWGFISYVYQQYLDGRKSKIDTIVASEVSQPFPSRRE